MEIFRFKRFVIHQDKCSMKVGTDAVLLGAWTDASRAKNILDIGTGTGIIAIMLAQKTNAVIDAIDIDEASCIQAEYNARHSPWDKRITVFFTALQSFSLTTNQKYDLIVSNPPYFDNAFQASVETRNKARHNVTLSFEELIQGVKLLLKQDGSFYVILPAREGSYFKEQAFKEGLYCNVTKKIKTKPEKETKRLLMKFEFVRRQPKESSLTIQQDDGSYTDEYIDFTKDYYIGLK